MIQAAKIIGTGLATTGLIGARVGIGVVFGIFILGVARNPSLRGQLFSSYKSLGWALQSPPKPHAFVSLPLQSKISLSSFNRHLVLTNIVTGIVFFIVFFYFRYYILPEGPFKTSLVILEKYRFDFNIDKDFFSGFFLISGFFF